MIVAGAIEVARDCVEERRFDALPEIAAQDPSVHVRLVADLVGALNVLCGASSYADLSFHQLADVAAMQTLFLANGATPGGLYPSPITHTGKHGNEWDAASVMVGGSAVYLYSKNRPRTKKPRARRKAA